MSNPQVPIPVVPIGLTEDQLDTFFELARKAFAIIQEQEGKPAQDLHFAHDANGDGTMALDGQELPTST